jgi:hypothetical protein
LARLVLLTLPYIAAGPKAAPPALDDVVDRMSSYMDSRFLSETSFIKPFKPLHPDASFHSMLGDNSCLHLLWLQIKSLKDNKWDIPFLPRPWFAFRTELESYTKIHLVPEFNLDLRPTAVPPLEPEYYFSILHNNEKQVFLRFPLT